MGQRRGHGQSRRVLYGPDAGPSQGVLHPKGSSAQAEPREERAPGRGAVLGVPAPAQLPADKLHEMGRAHGILRNNPAVDF